MKSLCRFKEIWLCDTEFFAPDGERPYTLCLVARELRSGRTIRWWRDDLRRRRRAPFDVGADSLLVAYYASAEIGTLLDLGWPLPANVLDLCAEFKLLTCGLSVPAGRSLFGALVYFGLATVDSEEKETMRGLALRGPPYTQGEKRALLRYCESDVLALERLLRAMATKVDVPRSLVRGRYMSALAAVERNGTPIDVPYLERLRDRWESIKVKLVRELDTDRLYDGLSFRAARWEAWLAKKKIPWPRLESGALDLSDDTFRQRAKCHAEVAPYRELRHALGKLKLESLAVGQDQRNRCIMGAFGSRTSRNQPSNVKYIFGPSVWLRSLIKPPRGHAVAYVDWESQEFAIGAALSNDVAMQNAYRSGDCYLDFGRQAGIVPPEATKQSYYWEREQLKACVLGTGFRMGPCTLAERIGQPQPYARHLIQSHQRTFERYWEWNDAAVTTAMLHGRIQSLLGWRLNVDASTKLRTIGNFPLQSNGAELLRLAVIWLVEAGIRVAATIHDAVLVESPIETLPQTISRTREIMGEASRVLLDGFEVRTDASVVRYPNRYMDPRGERMWTTVQRIVKGSKAG